MRSASKSKEPRLSLLASPLCLRTREPHSVVISTSSHLQVRPVPTSRSMSMSVRSPAPHPEPDRRQTRQAGNGYARMKPEPQNAAAMQPRGLARGAVQTFQVGNGPGVELKTPVVFFQLAAAPSFPGLLMPKWRAQLGRARTAITYLCFLLGGFKLRCPPPDVWRRQHSIVCPANGLAVSSPVAS